MTEKNSLKRSLRISKKNLRGDLVFDLFMAPKHSIVQQKYKNFLCKDCSAPPPAENFFEVCAAASPGQKKPYVLDVTLEKKNPGPG